MNHVGETLAARLGRVRGDIAAAEGRFGRRPGSVALLAVSKTRSAAEIRACAALGQRSFGESYVREAVEKIAALASLDLEWHFIGPIQSNKTGLIAAHFDWVHSVDRLKIAQRLSDQRPADRPPLNVCLQVNISGERTKSGTTPEALPELAAAVRRMPGLRFRGLMAVPAPGEDFDAQRLPFRLLREAQERLIAGGAELDTLSMGMSDDLEAAIAEGATLVRVGSAIFGLRPPRRTDGRP